jgi:hypothetical protein
MLILIGVGVYLGFRNRAQPEFKKIERKMSSLASKKIPAHHYERPVTSDNFPFASSKKTYTKQRPERANYSGTHHPSLPDSYIVADTVFAMRKEQYTSQMGRKLEVKGGHVLFENPSRPSQGDPVVIDTQNGKLFLVTTVLKINEANEGVRTDLLNKGFQEHHYDPENQILYVESNSDQLFKDYEELAALNAKVEVELVRHFYIKK